MIWRTAPFARFVFADYGEAQLLYDTGSGGTHVVDPVAAFVLASLQEAATDLDTLADAVSDAFSLPRDAALLDYLDALLRALQGKDLVRAVRP